MPSFSSPVFCTSHPIGMGWTHLCPISASHLVYLVFTSEAMKLWTSLLLLP